MKKILLLLILPVLFISGSFAQQVPWLFHSTEFRAWASENKVTEVSETYEESETDSLSEDYMAFSFHNEKISWFTDNEGFLDSMAMYITQISANRYNRKDQENIMKLAYKRDSKDSLNLAVLERFKDDPKRRLYSMGGYAYDSNGYLFHEFRHNGNYSYSFKRYEAVKFKKNQPTTYYVTNFTGDDWPYINFDLTVQKTDTLFMFRDGANKLPPGYKYPGKFKDSVIPLPFYMIDPETETLTKFRQRGSHSISDENEFPRRLKDSVSFIPCFRVDRKVNMNMGEALKLLDHEYAKFIYSEKFQELKTGTPVESREAKFYRTAVFVQDFYYHDGPDSSVVEFIESISTEKNKTEVILIYRKTEETSFPVPQRIESELPMYYNFYELPPWNTPFYSVVRCVIKSDKSGNIKERAVYSFDYSPASWEKVYTEYYKEGKLAKIVYGKNQFQDFSLSEAYYDDKIIDWLGIGFLIDGEKTVTVDRKTPGEVVFRSGEENLLRFSVNDGIIVGNETKLYDAKVLKK